MFKNPPKNKKTLFISDVSKEVFVPKSPSGSLVASRCSSGSHANAAEQYSTVEKSAKIIDVLKDSVQPDSAETIVDLENQGLEGAVTEISENQSSHIQVGHLDNESDWEDGQHGGLYNRGGHPEKCPPSGTASAPPLLNQVQHFERDGVNEAPAIADGQDMDETPAIEFGLDSEKILSLQEVGPATSDKAASLTNQTAAKWRGRPTKPRRHSSRKTTLSVADGYSSDSSLQVSPCIKISKNCRNGGRVSKPKAKKVSSPIAKIKNCSRKKFFEIARNDDIVLRRSTRSVTSQSTLNKSLPLEPHVEEKTTFPKSRSKRRSTNCRTVISLSDVDPSLSRHLTTTKRFSPVKKSAQNVKSPKNSISPNDTTSSKNFNTTESPNNPKEEELKRVSCFIFLNLYSC